MRLTYDPNGNIKTLNRFGVVKTGNAGTTTAMDNLTYSYQPNTNKLTHVNDNINKNNFDNDIDDQTPNNYTYDAIGNLIKDNAEEIQNITWNVYGKMTSVVNIKKERSLNFYYDAAGNRVKKIDGKDKATYYVRDAQGNVMAVYAQEKNKDITAESFYIYGSSRVGELDTSINMRTAAVSTFSFSRIRGIKRYEMSNHLGNVMVVVSDRKVVQTNGSYLADLVSSTDYYAFGMVMSDRSWNTEGYRFGMNGQEKVDEITSGHYTAEYWEYDARIGRRWNADPIVLPWESPYATFNNNPIIFSDPSGASPGQGEPVKETQPDYDPSKDKTSVVGQEVEVTAKRPEWQPQNYGEIKSAYRQQVRNDFATDKRQQGWYGQSPPEKYMRDLADAQLREFYRQSWVNSKFGAGKLEHWVPVWSSGKSAYFMSQIDDPMYQVGAFTHVVLAVADVLAIESIVKNVATNAVTKTTVVVVEDAVTEGGLAFGKNAKGHLIKHADVLGLGSHSPQQLQMMIPKLESAANSLFSKMKLERIGKWSGFENAKFYIGEGKMIVTQSNGTFITAINKTSNNWFNNAIPIK